MARRDITLLVFVCLAISPPCATALDICNPQDAGFTCPKKAAVVCYTGHFLTKMLSELNGGDQKSLEHVDSNLTPYLVGPRAFDKLPAEQRQGLIAFRNLLTPDQLQAYDGLHVCAKELSKRILISLPTDGTYILPSLEHPNDPFGQVVGLFTALFAELAYDVRSCPTSDPDLSAE